MGDNSINGSFGVTPVSSSNSRFAVASKSSRYSTSPLGMVHAPSSLFRQIGPPGCTSRTSSWPLWTRYMIKPALTLGIGNPTYAIVLWQANAIQPAQNRGAEIFAEEY